MGDLWALKGLIEEGMYFFTIFIYPLCMLLFCFRLQVVIVMSYSFALCHCQVPNLLLL